MSKSYRNHKRGATFCGTCATASGPARYWHRLRPGDGVEQPDRLRANSIPP